MTSLGRLFGPGSRRAIPAGLAGLIAVLVAHAAYCTAYVYQTSFLVEGRRTFCLVDDAMISMRYAQNLAAGHGLVWNAAGERVEGITNPGWTLVMSLLHLATCRANASAGLTCLLVQVLSAALLMATTAATYVLARRLAPQSAGAAILAAAATAAFYPLNTWALQGMEVGLLALLFTLAVCGAAGSGPSRETAIAPACWLAAATTVRLDAAAVALPLVVSGALIASPETRRSRITWGFGVVLGVVVLQTVLRLLYYGDALPNTYYLKMTGFPALPRITRGAAYTGYQALALIWPAVLFAVLVFPRRRAPVAGVTEIPRGIVVPLTAFVAACAYSMYVGADAWERVVLTNRYVTPLAPCLFAVMASFSAWCWDRRTEAIRSRLPWLALAVLSIILINAQGRSSAVGQWLMLERPPFIEDNIRNVHLAREFTRLTRPGARIAIDYAGTAPYFCDRYFVDLLGKSDRVVAHRPMHRGILGKPVWLEFYPGHLKWDYAYSIAAQRPDVVCAIWRRTIGDSQTHLRGPYLHTPLLGTDSYWLKESPHIRWDRLPNTLGEVP